MRSQSSQQPKQAAAKAEESTPQRFLLSLPLQLHYSEEMRARAQRERACALEEHYYNLIAKTPTLEERSIFNLFLEGNFLQPM